MKIRSLRQSIKLFFIFTIPGLSIVFFTTLLLYSSAVDIEIQQLRALSQMHASSINAVAEFDATYNKDFPEGGSRGATLHQILESHFEKFGFGKTGEFVLGEEKNDKIHFLLPSRLLGGFPSPTALGSQTAEPMRRALLGSSGFLIDVDYRGETVFAWHEPIAALNAGLVAKIDAAEIRKPYIVVVVLGSLLTFVTSALAMAGFAWFEARTLSRANNAEFGVELENDDLRSRATLYLPLIVGLVLVGGIAVSSVCAFIYSSEIDRSKAALTSFSGSIGSFFGNVAIFDETHTLLDRDLFTNTADATISQVLKFNHSFRKTGEIVLGLRSGDRIEFLLPSRFTGVSPPSVSLDDIIAEPMRRGVSGQIGVIESLDYRGERVMAAYHPIRQLNAGFVVKIDIDEIRRPYIIISSINISLAIFFIAFGILLAPQFIENLSNVGSGGDMLHPTTQETFELTTLQRRFALALIIGLSGFFLLLDFTTPLGFAAGIPYITLIILSSFITDKKGLLWLGCFVTALVIIGYAIAPNEGAISWQILTNRIYPILTIWLAVIILLRIKRTENSLRVSERRFSHTLDALPDATLCISSNGKIIFASKEAEQFFEYSHSELIDMLVEDLIPKEFRKKHVGLRRDFLDEQRTRPMGQGHDLQAVTSSGENVPVTISLSPIKIGNELGVTAIIHDISESQRQKEDIDRYARELERSNEDLQHFAYVASHDLQGPLREIQAFTERLEEVYADSLDEKGRGYLDHIVNSATHMRRLIDDMLSLSQATPDAQSFAKVGLSTLVSNVLDDMEATIEQAEAKIVVGDLPVIHGDPSHLRQMMQNIIGNAINFRRSDTPLIIEIKSETTAGKTRITISDNGIGFEPQYADRIFVLFERLHGRDEYPGTGIGLATCKKIAERHDGKITAEGHPGEGATFTITLPIHYEMPLDL